APDLGGGGPPPGGRRGRGEQAGVKRPSSALGDNWGVRSLTRRARRSPMRLGVSLAQVGRLADPAAVRSAATAAEQVGYSSLWVLDQLVDRSAVRRPRTGGVPPEGSLPEGVGPALDPLGVLAYPAAVP